LTIEVNTYGKLSNVTGDVNVWDTLLGASMPAYPGQAPAGSYTTVALPMSYTGSVSPNAFEVQIFGHIYADDGSGHRLSPTYNISAFLTTT
jgi:hypothetical protein